MYGLEEGFVGKLVRWVRNVPAFNGDFQKERVCCMVPKLCLSAGFETLCLLNGNDLCEFTAMWDSTQACWSASARDASQRVMLQDLAWVTAGWISDSVAAAFLWRGSQCWIHGLLIRERECLLAHIVEIGNDLSCKGPLRVIYLNLLPKTGLTQNSDRGVQGIFQLSFLQEWRVHLFPVLCSSVPLLS